MRFYDESSAARAKRACAKLSEERFQKSTLETADSRPGLAVVGVGMMGREHLGVAHLLGRTVLRGIFDQSAQSLEAADELVATLGGEAPHHYSNLEDVFADPTVDVVIVSTPNYTHWDVVRVALKSEKALLVEKPMATRLEDALAMVKAVSNRKALFRLGMQYRFKAQYVDVFREVKALASLGAVKTISMSEYRPPFLKKVEQWNKFSRYSGGTLVEKCCHYFDLINQMAEAEPISVYASGGQAVNFLDFEYEGSPSDIDDHAFVVINYSNDIRASFTLNMFSEELYEEMVVVGEKGRAVASERSTFKRNEPSTGALQVEVSGHSHYHSQDVSYPDIIEQSGHSGATFFAQESFLNTLESRNAGQSADSATVMQGLWAMIVASAAQASIQRKAVVDIEQFLFEHGCSSLALAEFTPTTE
ncbi:Gfo/Idh/MocA family oxidoreductase [Congregibacter brevis]|uniref:Gfo/Idh/MocA family oxidoreductase n=1 Tax=Congregibacter brevis TaxID=3081201 RepID=A0ABZ0IJN0_9GAMM|nr:Gfo/Idh/MocA family oxidoreductase [Congregibacter sp. IMCC45268]